MTATDDSTIEAQVVAIVRTRFDWVGDPDPGADLRGDLDLDSLHLVELQVAVEDHFRVGFDPFDEQLVEAFQTIRHLAAYVAHLVREEDRC